MPKLYLRFKLCTSKRPMRRNGNYSTLGIRSVFFASLLVLLSPPARARADLDQLECELLLAVPIYAVINPLLIEVPTLKLPKDIKKEQENKGWILPYIKDKKQPLKVPKRPALRRRPPPKKAGNFEMLN